jgi:uncharacterized membrane protein
MQSPRSQSLVRAVNEWARQILVSNLKLGKYLLLIIYIHVVFVLVSVPLVLALAGGSWLVAAAAFFLFFGLVFPPAIMVHARSVNIEA